MRWSGNQFLAREHPGWGGSGDVTTATTDATGTAAVGIDATTSATMFGRGSQRLRHQHGGRADTALGRSCASQAKRETQAGSNDRCSGRFLHVHLQFVQSEIVVQVKGIRHTFTMKDYSILIILYLFAIHISL